jgi:hypothetical protein
MQKVEKVAKVELDEATGALQAQLAAAVEANERSQAAVQALERRAEAWDGLCARVEAEAASAGAARDSLKDAFAQVQLHLSQLDLPCALFGTPQAGTCSIAH